MTTPHIIEQHGPNVRRIKVEPLVIACQELVNNRWITFLTFNEVSDDYAYTHSAAACRQQATKYIGGH